VPPIDHVKDNRRFLGERRVAVPAIEALLWRCNQGVYGLSFAILKVWQGLAAIAQDLF
jgi:hypothetical protein